MVYSAGLLAACMVAEQDDCLLSIVVDAVLNPWDWPLYDLVRVFG